MASEELEKAVNFLVTHAGQHPRDLPRDEVKQAILKVEEASLEGLSAATITTLAHEVIFTNSYDQLMRRRLLYCLIPQGQDFPLHVVTLAVSSAGVHNMSVSWQYAVLSWLHGLLEYAIILPSEPLVHIGYTTIFNLTSCLSLSSVACRLLYHMTVREDVTPNRVQVLLRLRLRPAFFVPVSYVLRLYHLFRPDMVAGRLADRNVVVHVSPALKARLVEARFRLHRGMGDFESLIGTDRVWQDGLKAEKMNVYQRSTAIPQPQFHIYTSTVEEKKGRVIYVTQYQKLSELTRVVDKWESWVWPSNPAAHFTYPLVLALFRPHQLEIRVSLTNWLEVALRTEVIEGLGSPGRERQESLLRSVQDLCFSQAASLPVVSNFLTELMTKWNQTDHFKRIIELFEFVGFTSVISAHESLLTLVSRLVGGAPLVTWCNVVTSLTAMACRWAWAAHQQEKTIIPDGYDWPQQQEQDSVVDGLAFLNTRLEKLFVVGVLDHDGHPLLLHHILDYYTKVDQYYEWLNLPLCVCPSPIMTLAILTSADLAATHRLGKALIRMKERLTALERKRDEGCQDLVLLDTLDRAREVHYSVNFFLSGVVQGKALSSDWKALLSPFYPFKHLEGVTASKEAQKFAAVTHSLPYLPFVCEALMETSSKVWEERQCKEVSASVLQDLREIGLTGIEECSEMYKDPKKR